MAEPIVALLEEVWSDLAVVTADLDEEQWARPTDCPGWTVKDNVAHMIGTENMLLGVEAPTADSTEGDHVRNDIGRFNEQWVAHYRGVPGADVRRDFVDVTTRRLEVLRAMTPEQWDVEGFTPEGPGPYRQFMAIRLFDCWYHDQDIRESLGRPGLLTGGAADASLARIPVKGLPYAIGKKAGAPAGSSVVVAVVDGDALTSTVAVPADGGRAALVDQVPTSPTVLVELDRRTLGRLAGGRWTGDRARREGHVRVEGDEALGTRVVDNLAFTI